MNRYDCAKDGHKIPPSEYACPCGAMILNPANLSAWNDFYKEMGTKMEIERLANENIQKVLRDGPRLRYDTNTWVEARDRKNGYVLLGGLFGTFDVSNGLELVIGC